MLIIQRKNCGKPYYNRIIGNTNELHLLQFSVVYLKNSELFIYLLQFLVVYLKEFWNIRIVFFRIRIYFYSVQLFLIINRYSISLSKFSRIQGMFFGEFQVFKNLGIYLFFFFVKLGIFCNEFRNIYIDIFIMLAFQECFYNFDYFFMNVAIFLIGPNLEMY